MYLHLFFTPLDTKKAEHAEYVVLRQPGCLVRKTRCFPPPLYKGFGLVGDITV
jgi:hypothetical protein